MSDPTEVPPLPDEPQPPSAHVPAEPQVTNAPPVPPEAPEVPAAMPAPAAMPTPPGYMPPAQTPTAVMVNDFGYPNAPATYLAAQQQVLTGSRSPLKLPTWGLGDVWITLALLIILQLAAAIVIVLITALVAPNSASQNGMPDSGWISIALTFVLWTGMGLWPWIAAKFKGNGIQIDFGLRASWADVGFGILYGILAFVVAMVLAVITNMLFGDFSSAAGDEALQYKDDLLISIVFALTVAVGAPFFEELCFRGLFLSSLAKRGMGAFLSIAIPALVFSLMHFEPKRVLLLFGVGFVLGLARWQRKSLTTSIVAHMCNNLPGAISMVLLAFGVNIPM